MPTVTGQVQYQEGKSADKPDFRGYSLGFLVAEPHTVEVPEPPANPESATCRYPVQLRQGEQPAKEQILRRHEIRTEVDQEGNFSADLPEIISGAVTARAYSAAGIVAATAEYPREMPRKITLKVPRPPVVKEKPASDSPPPQRLKLTGNVISGKHTTSALADRAVIIFAQPDGATETLVPVLTAKTDRNGYFSGEYPNGAFAAAYATVSGAVDFFSGKDEIPIRLEDGAKSRFPRKVTLVVDFREQAPNEGSEDHHHACACKSSVPRAADMVDLTQSPDSYSEDAGRCVTFTVPNRTLEEFSFYLLVRTTDPRIRGSNVEPPRRLSSEMLRALSTNITEGRDAALVANAKNRDIDPQVLARLARQFHTIDATTLDTAERITRLNRSLFELEAISKSASGRAPLGPDSPVDWDETPTFYQATTISYGHILQLKQVWRADGYSLGDLLYSLPLAPCQKKQVAIFDWQRSDMGVRTEAADEREALSHSLTHDRDIIEVVSTALREHLKGESSAVTMGFGQGGGVAGGGSGGGGAMGAVMGHAFGGGYAHSTAEQNGARDLTANALQQLRDRTMQATSAVRSQRSTVIQTVSQAEGGRYQTDVVANHNHCHAVTIEYFEVLRHFQVTHELEGVQECLFIPLEMAPFDYAKVLRWEDILKRNLRDAAFAEGFNDIEKLAAPSLAAQQVDWPLSTFAEEEVQSIEGQIRIRFEFWRQGLHIPPAPKKTVAESVLDFVDEYLVPVPGVDSNAAPPASSTMTAALLEQQRQDMVFIAVNGRSFADLFVDGLALEFVTSTGSIQVPVDATLVSGFANGVPLLARLTGAAGAAFPKMKRASILAVRIVAPNVSFKLDYKIGDVTGTYDINVVIDSAAVTYRTRHLTHDLLNVPALGNDLGPGDNAEVSTPLDNDELRNLRAEAERRARRLLRHLNDNLEFYHRIIWSNMNPDRRYMLLDGFLAPDLSGRSIASVVENRIVGIVGNCLVLPVAPGINLNPSFKVKEDSLLHHYSPSELPAPIRLSLPTQGVFAEAVMGSCNACEAKDETRFWRFEESPCMDEPTPISTLSTDSRRAEPPNLTAKDFPTPVINIQNAPPAPDPTGLAAALGVIGKPDLFRDVTGLTENQKNALAAYTQSLEAAKHFGSEAAKLAQTGMQQNNGGLDKSLAGIQKAKDMNLIDGKQAGDLAMGALRSMVGQGATTESKLLDSPEVKNLLGSATAGKQADVTLTRPNESVEIKKQDPSSSSLAPIRVNSLASSWDPKVVSAALKRLDLVQQQLPTGSAGLDLLDDSYTGRILISNFDVDASSVLKPEIIQTLEIVGALLNSSPEARAYLVGRASQTGPESWNMPLSEARAREVGNWLTGVLNVPPERILDIFGVGSANPIVDHRGFEDPLNRSVELVYSIPALDDHKVDPPVARPNGSTQWSIQFMFGGGVSYFASLAMHVIALTDRSDPNNMVTKIGTYQGLGIGFGLSRTKLMPKWHDVLENLPSGSLTGATNFETEIPLTFEDFDGRLSRLSDLSFGILVLGYAKTIVSFPQIKTKPYEVNVGGWTAGAVGINGSSTVGFINLKDS